MKIIRPSSTSEVVLLWLQAEIESERFSDEIKSSLRKYHLPEAIITKANLKDSTEESSRLRVLHDSHSWLSVDLSQYEWSLAELETAEVGDLNYVDYSYWNELSSGTHRVSRAAENIRKDKIVFEVKNDYFWSIARAFENGVSFLPAIIVENEGDLEILEGHARATGYLLAGKPASNLSAIIGARRK